MREPEGLIGRVKQMRRAHALAGTPPKADQELPDPGQLRALETRMAHMEELLEGLQDSVHRESQRQDRRLTELEARLEPGALAVALSRDARERGL